MALSLHAVWAVCAYATSQIYWTEFVHSPATGGITRADIWTIVREPIVPDGLISPYRIAIDPVEQKMYWTSTQGGGLQRANLDGTDLQTIVPASGTPFLGLAIDTVGRKA